MNPIVAFVFTARGPAGPAGTLGNLVVAETPSGSINGSNTIFTSSLNFNVLWVYLNGIRMKVGSDYNVIAANQFQFTFAPLTGFTLLIDYVEAS